MAKKSRIKTAIQGLFKPVGTEGTLPNQVQISPSVVDPSKVTQSRNIVTAQVISGSQQVTLGSTTFSGTQYLGTIPADGEVRLMSIMSVQESGTYSISRHRLEIVDGSGNTRSILGLTTSSTYNVQHSEAGTSFPVKKGDQVQIYSYVYFTAGGGNLWLFGYVTFVPYQ